MPRHCATCSRSESEATFYGDFCEYCTREKMLRELPDHVEMKICRRCGKIWNGMRFTEPTKKAVEDAIHLKLKGYKIKLVGDFNPQAIKVSVEEKRKEGTVAVETELKVRSNTVTCDACYKMQGGYWEGLVQLRGSEEKVKIAEQKIIRYINHTSAFISKTEEATNGLDVYISDKRTTTEMCMFLHFKPLTTYTLYGLKQGKRVYRNTYSIRLDDDSRPARYAKKSY